MDLHHVVWLSLILVDFITKVVCFPAEETDAVIILVKFTSFLSCYILHLSLNILCFLSFFLFLYEHFRLLCNVIDSWLVVPLRTWDHMKYLFSNCISFSTFEILF